jgi:N-acetylmuramoyl-L-alanine amidase
MFNLPQLIDMRGKLPSNGSYSRRKTSLSRCTRVWHHSLTKSHLGGSDAASFNQYHISLGWPGCGYHFVIEPKNVVNTPKGKRARIVYVNDVSLRTYHVGDSNDFAVGLCVAGDYRYEKLQDHVKASIDELQEAMVCASIGNKDKSHNEMAGYSWKACCEYNYMQAFKFLNGNVSQGKLPEVYTIQEGDTLWGIANGIDGLEVDEIIKLNPGINPTRLQIGQKIRLAAAQKPPASKKKYINLHGHMETWAHYPTNRPPIKAKYAHRTPLKPSKFGGLSYEIIGKGSEPDTFIIRTGQFGIRKIWAPRDRDSSITSKKLYK